MRATTDEQCSTEYIENATDVWFAGAEVELIDAMGICDEEANQYRGIGRPTRVAEDASAARFRDVPDEAGLLGHRLSWASKGGAPGCIL